MARPKKQGLDYFSLDVHMDKNVQLLEAEYGLEGFAIFLKLLQMIYTEGYFIEWNEDTLLLFTNSINSDINRVNAVVNACLRRSLFDSVLYEKYQILTSRGIQKRYFEACRVTRRKQVVAVQEYYLCKDDYCSLITEFIVLTPTLTPLNHSESTQIEIEIEIEIEREIERESMKGVSEKPKTPKPKKEITVKYAENVSMTSNEYNSLLEKHGETGTIRMITILDNYKGSSGKTYKSDYRAILSWVVEKLTQEQGVQRNVKPSGNMANFTGRTYDTKTLKDKLVAKGRGEAVH